MRVWCCGDHGLWAIEAVSRPGETVVCEPVAGVDFRTVTGLSEAERAVFGATDEVKPFIDSAGRRSLLVTSSYEGGATMVDLDAPGGPRARWCVRLKNAHSADALPGGRFAVAGSEGSDRVLLLRPAGGGMEVEAEVELPHGHGVVYDRARRCVWVHGSRRLLKMPTHATGGRWTPLAEWQIPGDDAHDLTATHDGRLILTTDPTVYRFDPDRGTFAEHEQLAGQRLVKSVHEHPRHGRLHVRADAGPWWSHAVVYRPAGAERETRLTVSPARVTYKARWDEPVPLPE